MNSDIDMWVKWMKISHPICRSQRWKRAAAAWRFKLVRTVSTFLSHLSFFTANEPIKLDHKKRAKKHTNLCPPPLPSHKSPVILPALDVWDTDVAFLPCWPRSIVVSCACGKLVSPLGLNKLGHCSPSGNKWLVPLCYFSIIFKVSSVVWVLFSFSLVWKKLGTAFWGFSYELMKTQWQEYWNKWSQVLSVSQELQRLID